MQMLRNSRNICKVAVNNDGKVIAYAIAEDFEHEIQGPAGRKFVLAAVDVHTDYPRQEIGEKLVHEIAGSLKHNRVRYLVTESRL